MKKNRAWKIVSVLGILICLEVIVRYAYQEYMRPFIDQDVVQIIKNLDSDAPTILYDGIIQQIRQGNSSVQEYMSHMIHEKRMSTYVALALEWNLSELDLRRIFEETHQLCAYKTKMYDAGTKWYLLVQDEHEKGFDVSREFCTMVEEISSFNQSWGTIKLSTYTQLPTVNIPGICTTCMLTSRDTESSFDDHAAYHNVYVPHDFFDQPYFHQYATLEHALAHGMRCNRYETSRLLELIMSHNNETSVDDIFYSPSFIKFLRLIDWEADIYAATMKDLRIVHMIEKNFLYLQENDLAYTNKQYEQRYDWVKKVRRLREAEQRAQEYVLSS